MYNEIRLLVQNQLGEYRAEVEHQRISRPHLLNIPLFSSLHGRVTTTAIRKLLYELEYSRQPDFPTTCTCIVTRTHGLPCAHDLRHYTAAGAPVDVAAIHRHWFYDPAQPTIHQDGVDSILLEPTLPQPRLRPGQSAGNSSQSSGPAARDIGDQHERLRQHDCTPEASGQVQSCLGQSSS